MSSGQQAILGLLLFFCLTLASQSLAQTQHQKKILEFVLASVPDYQQRYEETYGYRFEEADAPLIKVCAHRAFEAAVRSDRNQSFLSKFEFFFFTKLGNLQTLKTLRLARVERDLPPEKQPHLFELHSRLQRKRQDTVAAAQAYIEWSYGPFDLEQEEIQDAYSDAFLYIVDHHDGELLNVEYYFGRNFFWKLVSAAKRRFSVSADATYTLPAGKLSGTPYLTPSQAPKEEVHAAFAVLERHDPEHHRVLWSRYLLDIPAEEIFIESDALGRSYQVRVAQKCTDAIRHLEMILKAHRAVAEATAPYSQSLPSLVQSQ